VLRRQQRRRPSVIRKAVKAKILIVDDEPEVASSLAQSLEEKGYEVIIAKDDREALYYFDEVQPDLIILDIRFGPYDERMGLDILKEIRELKDDRTTPIIMLTGLSEEELEPLSFNLGATDFVRKSVSTKGLLARIKARLPHALREPILIDGCIEIGLSNNSVKVKRDDEWQRVHFEPKEFAVLKKLVLNPGRVIEREVLESFFENAENQAKTLNSYISTLRRELEPDPRDPQYILTKRGIGYWFRDYR
jgi:two-component system KDP operon response regulator KdpE